MDSLSSWRGAALFFGGTVAGAWLFLMWRANTLPLWALKGLLSRIGEEEERFEKQMKKRAAGGAHGSKNEAP